MADTNSGVQDPKPADAQGVTELQGASTDKSLNSQAKELPWVQEALRAKAELARIKAEQEKTAAEAERKRAESEGNYEKAIALEKERIAKLEEQHISEVKRLKLDAAFAHAGVVDSRVVSLFVDGYDPSADVSEYVELVKADPKNALFFTTQRQALKAPRGTEIPPPDDFVPERDLQNWLRSKDPKKRDRAIQHNREKYERQFAKG